MLADSVHWAGGCVPDCWYLSEFNFMQMALAGSAVMQARAGPVCWSKTYPEHVAQI